MRKELTNKLIEAYPDMFQEPHRGPLKRTFHIECGDGWFDILQRLCEDIHAMRPKVLQIKEKFGGLRFYAENLNEKQEKLVEIYEELSYKTCQKCGNSYDVTTEPLSGFGYIVTLCRDCKDDKSLNRVRSAD